MPDRKKDVASSAEHRAVSGDALTATRPPGDFAAEKAAKVPRGYKDSGVGVIPENWDAVTLREHLMQNATYGVVKAGAFLQAGVPMLRGGDIKDGRLATDLPFISEKKNQEYSRTILREGDVVIALVGYPGESAVVHADLAGANISRAVGLLRLRNSLLPDYLVCLLNSPQGRKEFLRPSAGSAQVVVNLSALNLLRLPLPPVPEQRAIAEALGEVDALLGALDAVIAKRRDLKQAAMQQLLTGRTRLPGFHGEWEVKRLGQICDIAMGRTPPRSNSAYWGPGHKWLSIADLQAKVVSTSNEEITNLAAAMMPMVPKGTLLMSFKLSIGRLCFAGCDLFTNEAICSFNGLRANPEFLYYALARTDFSVYGKQAVKGYTLNKESLKAVEVSLPHTDEQAAIAGVLADMDADIELYESRRAKSAALKQAKVQELLTGRTCLV